MPKFVLRAWLDRPATGRVVMDSWNGTLMGSSPTAGLVLRWVRALVLAAVVLPLGATAHGAAHGRLPSLGVMAGLLMLVAAMVTPLLRRELSATRVVGLVVGGQVFVHAVLTTVLATARPAATSGTAAAMPAHTHVSGLGHGTQSAADASRAALAAAALPGGALGMVLAHLAAALVVGLWLAVGEHALWAVLRVAGDRVVAVLDTVLGVVPVGSAPHEVRLARVERGDVDARSAWRGAGALGRRGPPVVFAS